MSRRSLIYVTSMLLLACGDDASSTSSAGSTSSEESSSSTSPLEPDGTSDGATSTTEDPSTDGTTTDEDPTSTGPEPACGNGVIDGNELCDGTDLGGESCTLQGFDGGELACAADCFRFDTSGCTIATCGDGRVQGDELCDGDDLQDESCATQGFDGGTLACARDCSGFDTTECSTCGNVIVDGDEACDGVALLGQTCLTQGFEYGEIACAADCLGFDTSGCGLCGDGSVGGAELCDGADLGGASCESLSFGGGTLACLPGCTFDVTGCEGPTFEVVDFPLATDPRFTMFGGSPWNAGDWFEGVRMTSVPSIGQIDIHLEIVNNVLSDCGVQEAEVSINGVALGTFAVVQGDTVIDQSFPVVPSIAGPVYTIRYETTTTVASGCGSAGYDEVGSTVTFYAG